ncbi:MAG: hypothetical protein IKD45_04270, partial [Clostridia bacterium]|nr:hypothetical protein [Clostridia bacterium]
MKKTSKILVLLLSLAILAAALVLVTSAEGEVAEVNGTKYTTFAEAVAAAQDGETVKLIANATVGSADIAITKNLTVDLGGYTLNAPYGFTVNGAYNFTIMGDGVITCTRSGSSAKLVVASNKANVTISGAHDGISITTTTKHKPNVFEMTNSTLTLSSTHITITPGYVYTYTVINLAGDSDLTMVNSTVKSTAYSQKLATTYVVKAASTSTAKIQYCTIVTNHTILDVASGTKGKVIGDGTVGTIFLVENSSLHSISIDKTDKTHPLIAGTITTSNNVTSYSKPNGKFVFKNSEVLASHTMFALDSTDNNTVIECYDTQLIQSHLKNHGAQTGGAISSKTDVYLYDGSSINVVDYAPMIGVAGADFVYFTPGAKVNWEGDTKRIETVRILDPETGKVYEPTLDGKNKAGELVASEGDLTFTKAYGPTAISGSGGTFYTVVKFGETLPVTDLSYTFNDAYSTNASGVLTTTASGSKVNSNLSKMGLSTGSGWVWDFNPSGEAIVGSLVNGNNKVNNCFKYYSLTEKTGKPNFSFGLGATNGINVFDKNSDGSFKHEVLVHESQFATDTGSFVPFGVDTGTRGTATGGTTDNTGTLTLNVSANGTVTTNGTLLNDNVKAYTDGRWNTVQFVIYKNSVNEDGTIGAATTQGIGYAYLNGVLVATKTMVYDSDKNGSSYFYGPRYDVASNTTVTTGANGNTLLVDNVTVKAFCDEKLTADGKTNRGDYVHESQYFTGNVKIGPTSFSDINEAITEANKLGTVAHLSGDATSTAPIVTDGYITANGYTIYAPEGSNPSNTIVDENNDPIYYDFRAEYNGIKIPVYWVTEYGADAKLDGDGNITNGIKTEIGVGDVPTPPVIEEIFDDKTYSIKFNSGWLSTYWTDANVTYNNGEIPPLTLSQVAYIRDNHGLSIMKPVAAERTVAMVVIDDATGNVVNYSEKTSLGANDSPFKSFKSGETLKLLTDVTTNGARIFDGGTYSIDLNGHKLVREQKNSIAIVNENTTLNVYSSVPGGYVFCAGGSTMGGSMFHVNAADISETVPDEYKDKTAEFYATIAAAIKADGAEGGAGAYGNAILNIGKFGDIPGSNLTLQGDCLIEPRQGNDTCAVNVDGATLIRSSADYAAAILARFWFGTINVKNVTFLGVHSGTFIGNHENGAGSEAVATVDNCVIVTPEQSEIGSSRKYVVGPASTGFKSITFTNCVSNGAMNPCNGGVVWGKNCAGFDFYGETTSDLVKAYCEIPMTMAGVDESSCIKVSYPRFANNKVTYDRFAYILPYGTTEMPEGFNEGTDRAIILPTLNTKTVKPEEAVSVTYKGLGDNKDIVHYYIADTKFTSAPTAKDYTGTAVKLTFTGWNETLPETVTENITLTPKFEVSAIITASVNLSLYSDFGINLYIPAEYEEYIVGGNYTKVTVGGKSYLMTTVNQPVDKAADNVVFEVNVKEGDYTATATATVSIAAYANAILGGEAFSAGDKQLMYYT